MSTTTLRNRRQPVDWYTVTFSGYSVSLNGKSEISDKVHYTTRMGAKSLIELRTNIAKSFRGKEIKFKEGKGTVCKEERVIDSSSYGEKGRPEHTLVAMIKRYLNYEIIAWDKYEPEGKGCKLPCEIEGTQLRAKVRGERKYYSARTIE